MNNKEKVALIKCPHCGTEYLPEEIYVPTGFFGHPTDIERTYDGRIVTFLGKSVDPVEKYKCDACGHSFMVEAQIKFNTYADTARDLTTEYTTKLYANRISLFEE